MAETPSKIAAKLVEQLRTTDPLRAQLQAAVDAAQERVQKFMEDLSQEFSDQDEWDYFLEDAIDDWDLGWLNGNPQRVNTDNVSTTSITFYDEDEGTYYILDFDILDNLEAKLRQIGAEWRAEYLSEREEEERRDASRDRDEREELLAEIEALDPRAAELLRTNGFIKED